MDLNDTIFQLSHFFNSLLSAMSRKPVVDGQKIAQNQEYRELELRLSANKVSVGTAGLYVRTLTDARILAPALSSCGDSLAVAKMLVETYSFSALIRFDAGLFTPLKTEGSKVTKIL